MRRRGELARKSGLDGGSGGGGREGSGRKRWLVWGG